MGSTRHFHAFDLQLCIVWIVDYIFFLHFIRLLLLLLSSFIDIVYILYHIYLFFLCISFRFVISSHCIGWLHHCKWNAEKIRINNEKFHEFLLFEKKVSLCCRFTLYLRFSSLLYSVIFFGLHFAVKFI